MACRAALFLERADRVKVTYPLALVTVGFLTVAGHSTVALAIAELAFTGALVTLGLLFLLLRLFVSLVSTAGLGWFRAAILVRWLRADILMWWFWATILRGWVWVVALSVEFATPLRVGACLLNIPVLRGLHIHRE